MALERRAVVLVSRPSPPRMFVPGLEAAFLAALRNATGRDVRVYYGNETVAQTVTDAARHAAVSYTTTPPADPTAPAEMQPSASTA